MSLKSSALWRSAALAAAFGIAGASPSAQAREAFVSPGAGEALAPGAIVDVRWASLCDAPRDREIDEAEIVLSLDGGRTFPIRVSPELKSCATHFLWKVPALPAAHARLALRAGADERDGTETIEILSQDFRILSDPDGRVEQLRRRAAELFTPSDPSLLTAEDLLEHTMSAARDRIALPASQFDAALPPSSPSVLEPESTVAFLAAADLERTPGIHPAPARAAGAQTPLRL